MQPIAVEVNSMQIVTSAECRWANDPRHKEPWPSLALVTLNEGRRWIASVFLALMSFSLACSSSSSF